MRMKTLVLASSAAAALALSAGAASAEPDGWYGAIDAGYQWIEPINIESEANGANFNIDVNDGWAAFARLGYRFNPNWRVELEGGYRSGDIGTVRAVSGNGGLCNLTPATGGVRKAIVPFRSAMIVSEPLEQSVADSLFTEGRSYAETRRMMRWFRKVDNRLMYGGRGAFGKEDSESAFEALRRAGVQPAAEVQMQAVIEEECTGNGALACLHRCYRADAAVIPEPFDHTLMTAQLGVMWVRLTVTGKPAHVLDTSAGSNAIESAFALMDRLRRLEERWNEPAHRHPAYAGHRHPVNFNLGRIEGGEWTSSVPSRCTMDVRVGFHPGMTTAEVREAILETVEEARRELGGLRVEVEWRGFQAEGCVIDRGHPMMRLLADSHRTVRGGEPADLAATCTTDARFFNLYGDTPATCYGPEAAGIHGIDESVSLDSLRDVTRVLALFMAGWCGLERR